ncbi:hypothetical protein PITCH_A420008 [uncultured Desulfobacterium sp.]|uniref:Uncharacterized protein n=1 Tax=uncultured Desulfobacterium sp. TaxID=201089 RepID=A0A445MZX4_9BACT|nr:hypothetical protein PITCH_A420008 [uncultured Desulfobacterium sp.]
MKNNNAMEFVAKNGDELARNIFFYAHNLVADYYDVFWNILESTKQHKLFRDQQHAFVSLLTTLVSIHTELEMQAIYEKYGDDVYAKLGEHVTSYYMTFLKNFTEDEENMALFLMHNAHEVLLNNENEGVDSLLALQLKRVSGVDEDFSPNIFHPLTLILSEREKLADIIESHIS